MAHERDDWRPDVNVPRDYPPPPAPPWALPQRDPRDTPDTTALRRCLADVEAAAQRLRALLKALDPAQRDVGL
jgi:hypothetical protein